MKALRTILLVGLMALLLPYEGILEPAVANGTTGRVATDVLAANVVATNVVATGSGAMITGDDGILSPVWDAGVRRWATHIAALSGAYGLDPDFIAAVIRAESLGDQYGVSYAGAVGLMGVMPKGPGFESRPSAEELKDPGRNLRWGVSILTQIIRQSGGDVNSALSAYNGGWDGVDSLVPRAYAAGVLNYYGRAVAARNGVSPDIAKRWTIALEIHGGNISSDPVILPQQPVSGLRMYGEHVLYSYVTPEGQLYYVKGYAVPLALVVPMELEATATGSPTALEDELMDRLYLADRQKEPQGNPRVLLACLPSLARLRGRINTRWFAPSYCPAWHR